MPEIQIDMKMTKVSKKNANVLEAGDGEENNKFNDGIDSLGKCMTTVEEKLQKNQSSMIENQIDEVEIKNYEEWEATQQPRYDRSSWRRLDRKENFDVNMSEKILGKYKFNHEGLVENVTYPTNESPVKKAKANKDREDGYVNSDCKQTVSHVSSELTKVILAAANGQADRKP
ncbi:hypothetical protein ES332_A05G256200v1 [Gossypium tomentosum]|uniref:Uncharacterized protein n=1 Tax=Gossypium tomentosum TaxID=34277 RepID=A0A5D2QJM5_GOSTO|nr:hypothetical protein ES332_A05G256200v1 [Gossypium tomentosum]